MRSFIIANNTGYLKSIVFPAGGKRARPRSLS